MTDSSFRRTRRAPRRAAAAGLALAAVAGGVVYASASDAAPVPATPPVSAKDAVPTKAGALDFAPYTATFLGAGATDERANAVAIGADGAVVVGGSGFATPGATAVPLGGGGAGTVVRLDRSGQKVLSVARLAGAVEDLAVASADGRIGAVGPFGLAVLDKTASKLLWTAPCAAGGADKSTGRRVDVAADGTVAALCNHVVTTYSPAGAKLGSWKVDYQSVDDVAISGKAKLVYAIGGSNLGQLRVAKVMAWPYTGGVDRWIDWGWNRTTIGPDVADTFSIRIAIGADDQLYFLGGSAGGNSIFHRDAQNPSKTAPNTAGDMYTNPYNTSSNNILYLARLDPATGKHLAGQFVLARNTAKGNKGNTIEGRAITADENGRVLVTGISAYAIDQRDARTTCGKKPAGYSGGDLFLLQTSADLKTRTTWAVLGNGGEAPGVAARGGVAAAVASTSSTGVLTCKPLAGLAAPSSAASDAQRDALVTVFAPASS